MWIAVKHNNSKHLRLEDSGISDKVHLQRYAELRAFLNILHRYDVGGKKV